MENSTHVRHQRWQLLRHLEKLLNVPMMVLGFIWLILLVIELTSGLTRPLQVLSGVIWIIFIVDFLLSFIIAPEKGTFLRRNVLTLISLVIPAFRVLRIFRLFRLLRGLRLAKVITSLNRSMRILTGTMRRRGFGYVLILTVLVAFVGAAGMYAFEKDVRGGLNSYGEAVWWTAMMVITVGSDYWPKTAEGRVLTYLIALYGFAALGYMTATIATFFIGQDDEDKNKEKHNQLTMQLKEIQDLLRKMQVDKGTEK